MRGKQEGRCEGEGGKESVVEGARAGKNSEGREVWVG